MGVPIEGIGGGGDGGGLGALFQNKTFWSYISALGQDLLSGKPGNVNALTQQNIASSSYMDILKKMLSGEMPEGGKITMDGKGMSISVPKPIGQGGGGQAGSPSLGNLSSPTQTAPSAPAAPAANNDVMKMFLGDFNPFANGQQIKAADLAGLSPEMISSALQFKFNQMGMKQKAMSDIADMAYKSGLLQHYQNSEEIEKAGLGLRQGELEVGQQNARRQALTEFRNWVEMATPAPYDIPGLGTLTNNQFKALDAKTQAYGYYALDATSRGDKVLSLADFEDRAKTTHQKDFAEAVKGGYKGTFNEWLLQLARAGATRISLAEKLEEKDQVALRQGKYYFQNPDWVKDVDNYLMSNNVRRQWNFADDKEKEKSRIAIKYITDRIQGGGGEIQGIGLNASKTGVVFKVKWPDGTIGEVPYAAR